MTTIKFTDALIHDGTLRKTDDGYVAQARVARGGNVQDYLGSEMGVMDQQVVRVYRPSDAVFAPDAINTYARKPITIGHPAGGVSDATWKNLAVGEIDRDVLRDGEFVSVPLLFRDATAIALMQSTSGPRELSMGYEANVDFTDGVTPDGEEYDAIMTDFRMNHVAVVSAARGGKELRIGDGADATWGATPYQDRKDAIMANDANTRTVIIDGLSVITTDAGAQALEKLQGQIKDGAKALTDAETAHTTALTAKDEEIGTLKADNKALKDAAITPAKMTSLIADRVALETTVKAIDAKIEVADVSDADLRKAAVASKLGDEMVADASEAEIVGMFKAIAKDAAKADPFADARKGGVKTTLHAADAEAKAHAAYIDGLNPEKKDAA